MAELLSREALLAEFLQVAAAAPHRFGEWDCLMILANWGRLLTGIDPAADLRGTYGSEFGWKRIAAGRGGFVPLVGGLAVAIGGRPRLGPPAPGDVAVISLPEVGDMGGIWTGLGWAMKPNNGLTIAMAPARVVWALG